MTRQIVVTDNIDGSPDARTITYSVGGQKSDIDQSHDNREKPRHALAPFPVKSRVVESSPPAPGAVR
jgi:hypothetical protein